MKTPHFVKPADGNRAWRPSLFIWEHERTQMRRYYFNFRKGDELSVDRRGMWLPDEGSALKVAIQLWGTVLAVAIVTGDPPEECEYEIANDNGDTVAVIPFGACGSVQ